jgi:hypothetical protein
LFLFQHPNGLKEGIGRVDAGRFAISVCLAKSLHQIRYGGNGKGETRHIPGYIRRFEHQSNVAQSGST